MKPFYYEVLDNFLPIKELEDIKKMYSTLEFKEIHTDLYNFLQSNELNFDERLTDFKKKLDSLFKPKIQEKDPFYTIFASYYRKNDFLLCHDDMVDERLFAFTFYLEDFESGKLVLYENDCEKIHKSVDVKENRLVIFEVGEKSFHEVAFCQNDGRKAITGWINSKDKKNISKPFERAYKKNTNIEFFDLNIDIDDIDDFLALDFGDIEIDQTSSKIQGPFVDRKVVEIELEKMYAPSFNGYELIHSQYLLFRSGDYILCNDIINKITEDILDVFIFKGNNISNFITYVDQDSNVDFNIDAADGQMLIGKRNNHVLCIHRSTDELYLKHYIYKKI